MTTNHLSFSTLTTENEKRIRKKIKDDPANKVSARGQVSDPLYNVGQEKRKKELGDLDSVNDKDSSYESPPRGNLKKILAHAFGTCHCPTSHRTTKAKARAKPPRPTN